MLARLALTLLTVAAGAALPLVLAHTLPTAEAAEFDFWGMLLLSLTTAEAAAIAALLILRPLERRQRTGAEARGFALKAKAKEQRKRAEQSRRTLEQQLRADRKRGLCR